MDLKQVAKQFERRFLRPLARRFRREPRHPPVSIEAQDRLLQLERRLEALESAVREDLGLRYLEMELGNPPRDPETH